MYRHIHEKDLNEYEKENKRLSYKNLFYNDDALILCNNIASDYEDLEIVNGEDYDDEYDEYTEIFQYYIIDDSTAQRLMDETNEIIYYHNRLDIYILGVTHYGTNWGYVLTKFELIESEDRDGWYKAIKIDDNEEDEEDED